MKNGLILGIMAVVLGACSPGGTGGAKVPAAPAVHAESGLRIIPLSVTRGDKVHRFRVEVANTGQEQARGLMFRTAMGPNEGMIFPMNPPRNAAFWMKNTVISLDIIFIGTDRRVLNIGANTVPYSEDAVPSAGSVSAVLELNAGRAAELGIVPGDKVEW